MRCEVTFDPTVIPFVGYCAPPFEHPILLCLNIFSSALISTICCRCRPRNLTAMRVGQDEDSQDNNDNTTGNPQLDAWVEKQRERMADGMSDGSAVSSCSHGSDMSGSDMSSAASVDDDDGKAFFELWKRKMAERPSVAEVASAPSCDVDDDDDDPIKD